MNHIKSYKIFESTNHEIYDIIKPIATKHNDLTFDVNYVTELEDGTPTSFIIKIVSDSRLFHETDKDGNDIVFYRDRDSDKYNMLVVSNLVLDIRQELHKFKSKFVFKVTETKLEGNLIVVKFERNLIHEVCSMCEEILLELKDLGFNIVARYSMDNHKYYLVPKRITMVISRDNKFKYLKDESEKPIFYPTGRGTYDEVNIDDYIEWLSGYLGTFGLKYKGDKFSYEDKNIELVFEK